MEQTPASQETAAHMPVTAAKQSISGGEFNHDSVQATATSFVVLFCIVGIALWGLPFYYDFMVKQYGWSRAQVTSGSALSKLVVGPAFGFVAAGFASLIDCALLGALTIALLPKRGRAAS